MKFHWQRSDQTLKIPLRFVLIAPFVLLTIGAVGLVGYLSWHNGQQAVNDLANQLMDEVGDRVTLKLDTYLETPYVVNELNIDAIELGQINPNHLPQIERHFWRQIWRFDSVISIAVGTEDGEFTAIGRPGKDVAPVLKISTSGRETNGYLQVYNTDNQGNRSGTPEINRPYDPRERPWYVDTMRAGEPIWSEIYPDFTDPRLVITASQPLYDEVNQLKGVLSVDLLLSTIGEFLQTIEIGKQGQIFIIEQSGLLVANSTSEKPFVVVDEEVQRIQATESKNPLIRFTTAQLQKKYGDFTQIRMSQQGRFQLNQNELNQWQEWAKEQIPQSARQSFTKDFFLQVTPLRDERGLDWLIVIVVPEADFMGQIYANTRTTLVLSAGALLGAIAFGLLTAQWINRPIQRLSRASRALAEGEWHQALKEDSPIAELQVLAHAFNQTAEQLQQAFDRVKIALQASEEKFTKVFRVSPDPIGIATPEGRYLEVNDAFLNLFGYSREEVIGRKTAEIGLWVNLQERQHYVKLAQADGRVRNLECTMRQKSGRLLTILFSAESIELQGQLCLIGIAKEITDRKQLELALQRSEAKLNHVLNSAIAAVTSIRVFPDGNWQYEYRSEGCEAVFGYTAQELMADPALWQSRVFPDDAAQVLELNVKNFMTEGTFTEEYRFYHKDDSLRWISGHLTSRWDEATASWLITAVDIDITDRVCAEEALRQSEATKNQILKAIPDLIVWMTADGTCIDLIEGNSINTVISRVDAIGKNLFDLLPIELAHQRMNAIQHALRTGDVQIYEQQITNNEKTRYEEVRIVAITADQVLTIIRDITDRKQAEAALEAQRAFFYQVIDVIPSPVFVKDSEGRFIVANQAIVAVHGTSVKEVLGKREIDFNPHFDPAQIERYLANNREVMMTRQSKQNPPHQVPTATGQLRWFQTLLSPLIDANGHVQGIVGNSVDITDLKQVEEALQQQNQALRESEERFRSAFQDAPIGMALIGLNDRWLRANPMLCDMLDYSESKLQSMNVSALVHPEDINKLQHCIEQALSDEHRNAQVELRYCCHEGRIAWGLMSLSLVRDSENQPLYYVAQIQDITERQAIDRMKNEFISIVSHELRTPLTAIRGFLGLLNTGIYDNRPEKAKRMLEQALTNSDRLVRLVNDILDLERLDSGRVPLVMEVCGAEDLMQKAVGGVQSIADQAVVMLSVIPTDAQVWAAPDSIIQTLTNLLGNAIKFSPPHTVITLAAQPQSDWILFQVKDQGRGIPADKLETIFGRFQQVDVSDSRQKGGTGLGLAICQSIIQQHGGNIWVESTLGEGSTFCFTLPTPSQLIINN